MVQAAPSVTRRQRKKARTRRDIYEAAMRLFGEAGFEGTSIVQICEAADVGRGTFFLHFPTKASLLYEFNERFAEEFRDTLREPRGSAREELTTLVERMSVELETRAAVMRAMLSAFFASPESIAAASRHGRALPELVTSIIERGQARGEFNPRIDARLAAASFFATSAAIVSGQVFQPGEASSREINRQFLEHVFHGLGAATG